jgi:hypothetical protein
MSCKTWRESNGHGRARPPAPKSLILVGGVLLALRLWPDLGALIHMHAFWKVLYPQMRQMQQIHFGKNLALTGASLLAFALFAECGEEIGLMAGGPRSEALGGQLDVDRAAGSRPISGPTGSRSRSSASASARTRNA